MPISRVAFEVKMPGDSEVAAEDLPQTPDGGSAPAPQPAEGGQKKSDVAEESSAPGSSRVGDYKGVGDTVREIHRQNFLHLPPADVTSAGKQDDIGPTRPRTETPRSVATGSDVPQFTRSQRASESNDIDWEEARGQTEVIARRAQKQKSAAGEHLTRIHTIVERILDMTEAHHADSGRKLQSLEDKVADLEMRYSLNRSMP